jgi:hypothetical protein
VSPFKERGNYIAQGEHHNTWIQRLEVSRQLKHFEAFADIMLRFENVESIANDDLLFSLGIRTPMLRNYRDF